MSKITFCIPSKDNLRYLKSCVQSIKNNSTTNPEILVYVDSNNDGTVDWLMDNNIRFILNETTTPRGIATGYNRCIQAATTEVVCMFHADMYMAPGFDKAILEHIKPKAVVAGTRIEPPLHPEGKEKIIRNFGMYPEDFREEEFLSYVEKTRSSNVGKITRGIFAPWAVYRSDIMTLGLHDENLHSFHEDSDIFNRFVLAGFDIVQTWEGFVYHLTCRGGQFQDGIEEITRNQQFHYMKNRSFREFVRKWGQPIRNDEYHYPTISPKYNICFIVNNTPNIEFLESLEIWADGVFVDLSVEQIDLYINQQQPHTNYNLRERVFHINNLYKNEFDVKIEFDMKECTLEDINLIPIMNQILEEAQQENLTGLFEVGKLKVYINKLEDKLL